MNANGLAPGQAWNMAHGPRFQARFDRNQRAHVIGEALATDDAYGRQYVDFGYWPDNSRIYGSAGKLDAQYRRPWHTDFGRAMRAARFHNRMMVAAERQGVE